MRKCLADPASPHTFEQSKLDHAERDKPFHKDIHLLHKDLIRLRAGAGLSALCSGPWRRGRRVLGPDCFLLRYFAADFDDRLLLFNFGSDLRLDIAPEPLLAPPAGRRWAVQWSSEDPIYGGCGMPEPETEDAGWMLTGRCAMVLKPVTA